MADFSDLDAAAERFWCTLFRFMLGGCKNLQDVSAVCVLCDEVPSADTLLALAICGSLNPLKTKLDSFTTSHNTPLNIHR